MIMYTVRAWLELWIVAMLTVILCISIAFLNMRRHDRKLMRTLKELEEMTWGSQSD